MQIYKNLLDKKDKLAVIGLGYVGLPIALAFARKFSVIGFDLKQERADKLEAAAKPGTIVKGTTSISEMAASLKTPRKIMMLVPAGKPVDDVIQNLLPYLEPDDILIDGGNSFYKDTLKRIEYLHNKNIHFFGMGVSGGEAGARFGTSMMPGGDKEAYQYLKPILESIAAKVDDTPCVAYMGNNAAGHYVKMVHNGIEYAMMQLISEVYDFLIRSANSTNEDLHVLFKKWNEGVLQSFLIEVTAEVFKTGDDSTTEKNDYLLDKILDVAGAKGTGKWTSQEAMDLALPIPTIDMAVAMRDISVYKDQRIKASQLYKQEIKRINIDDVIQDLEKALAFSFIISYVQGLSMIAKASEIHSMNIPLPDVIKVWKGGCIIRSALLKNFSNAFTKNPTLENILLDAEIAMLMKSLEESARRIVTLAIDARVPVSAMSSAISYYDAFLSERLPINLVQAQRDFFGAHTYKRIDKEGVFHTEWSGG